MNRNKSIMPIESVGNLILVLRRQKIILDYDLAKLYGVPTKRLNEQVRRNKKRFPEDFMFQLTQSEKDELVAKCDRFAVLKHSSLYKAGYGRRKNDQQLIINH